MRYELVDGARGVLFKTASFDYYISQKLPTFGRSKSTCATKLIALCIDPQRRWPSPTGYTGKANDAPWWRYHHLPSF